MSGIPRRPIQDLYASFHAILNLYVTNACNLQCRHCGTGSGPAERSALRLDETSLDDVRSAIRDGPVKALHVSGGEPFLRRRELGMLSALAVEEDILLAVNTNGYWAGTVARGEALLRTLPGISQVILSTDIYHAEWLANATLVNAAIAGVRSGRLVDVVTVTPFGRRDAFTEALDERLADAGIIDRVRRLNASLGPTARPVPLPDDDLAPWQAAAPSQPCSLLNRPTVLEDGSVLACCNTPMAGKCTGSPLILGQVGDAPLNEIMARSGGDRLLGAMRTLGPAALAELIEPHADPIRRGRYRADDICTLCTDMMARPDIVSRLRRELEGSAGRIVEAALALQSGAAAG